jgi:endonuclease-3
MIRGGIAKTEKRKLAENILRTLSKHLRSRPHLGAHSEYSPFQVLISAVLSQRTRDESTAVASARLFEKFGTAEKIARAPQKEIEKLIRASGFYRQKAKRIREVSGKIIENFGGKVPKTKKELMSLPGVGAKTANCVLVYAFGTPAIPVDTHVHRISNRLGLVKTKSPEKTEKELEKIFERKDWLAVNDLFVRFGQTVCRPVGPKCAQCPLLPVCPFGKEKPRNCGKTGKYEKMRRSPD